MRWSEVIGWLLSGDVAVQFQTTRDLMRRVDLDLQRRIAEEGEGATLLAARGDSQHWGLGFYRPKWTCSHYTLLDLKNLGLSRSNSVARDVTGLILRREKGRDGGLNPSPGVTGSDACINGMALNYAAYFGADESQLSSIIDFLLEQQLGDGGFNCRLNRSGAHHSSVHTTLSVFEGISQYRRGDYLHRVAELGDANKVPSSFSFVIVSTAASAATSRSTTTSRASITRRGGTSTFYGVSMRSQMPAFAMTRGWTMPSESLIDVVPPTAAGWRLARIRGLLIYPCPEPVNRAGG